MGVFVNIQHHLLVGSHLTPLDSDVVKVGVGNELACCLAKIWVEFEHAFQDLGHGRLSLADRLQEGIMVG